MRALATHTRNDLAAAIGGPGPVAMLLRMLIAAKRRVFDGSPKPSPRT